MDHDEFPENELESSRYDDLVQTLIDFKMEAEDMYLPIFNRVDAVSVFISGLEE